MVPASWQSRPCAHTFAGLTSADRRERHLDYLYSVAVAGVIAADAKPEGLSLRAFEHLCNERFERIGT